MAAMTRLWLAPARARRFYLRARRRLHKPEDLVRKYAPDHSFVDVGAMWGIHAARAFLAEEAGATSVTAMDLMSPTPEYEAEHERRGSKVRFVHGDYLDTDVLDEIGTHDVVWATGLITCAPHPALSLERLKRITGELLIVDTAVVPEIPGIPQASVFYPGLDEGDRSAYIPTCPGVRKGITEPFDAKVPESNWWWGLSPSAFRGVLFTAGLEPVEWIDEVFHLTVVARPISSSSL